MDNLRWEVKGKVLDAYVKEIYVASKKATFNQLLVKVGVDVDGGQEIYYGKMWESTAKTYLALCGTTVKDLASSKRPVQLTLVKKEIRVDGEVQVIKDVKYWNLLNEEGEILAIPVKKVQVDW